MEMMVRIAGSVWMSKENDATWTDVTKNLFENHANVFFEQFVRAQPWRDTCFWCEENDYIMKQHKLIIDNVYHKYSGAKTLPGKKKFMSLSEVKQLIDHSGIDKDITERDISISFNCSMMTQVDELTSERIFEMSFTEFIELIGRLADKTSLCSMYYTEEEVSLFFLFFSNGPRLLTIHRGRRETRSRCV
jgi:hypothetical protein